MVEYYVEPAGNDGNLGTAPGAANAWLTVKYALETAGVGLVAGDNVWLRRTINEIPAGPADISCVFDGDPDAPISVIGWPRDEATGTATFTNGSTAVTAVSIAADREKHAARRIKCDADGEWYLITRVVDANTFTIDREYVGTTAAATNFTIQKDDDFDTRPVAGQAPWDGDADDLPIIDFNDANFQLKISADNYHIFKNIELKDSTDPNGIILFYSSNAGSIIGCLIKQSVENDPLIKCELTYLYAERVIIEGSGAGASQEGISGESVGATVHLKDCAIYNCGDSGIYLPGEMFMENVNIGVEIANGDDDITLDRHSGRCYGIDVKLGGTNGYVLYTAVNNVPYMKVAFENYGKILGANKKWFVGGTMEKVAADGVGNHPNQRSGGDANVIEITPDVAGLEHIEDWAVELFTHEFEVDTTARTWRYYVQNDACGALSPTNLWIVVEYIKQYDDTSEYVTVTTKSDETVNNRADNNDWTQHIEVPSITPAISSKVRIKCYVSKHSAAGHIYIDPKVSNP